MSEFHILDPNEHSVTVCGVPIEGGWAEDTFVEIAYITPAFRSVVGAGGDVSRSKSNDNRARITITLLSTALANGLLSAIHNLDKAKSNGAGVGPLLIKDNQGLSLFAGEHSWVAEAPAVTIGQVATPRAWVIECANLASFNGGN